MKIVVREYPKLYKGSELESFLGISPRDPAGWEQIEGQLVSRDYWRRELTDLLLSYNQAIGNDSVALQRIKALRSKDKFCVFTGQQLGFMGGPTYTILKAVTCLLLARKVNAIPIFWLATEDHDVDEIDHAYLLDTLGNLRKFHLSLPKDGRFVEDLELHPQHFEVINKFLEAADLSDLKDAIAQETSYTRLMTHILVRLFAGTGLVFVEPYLLRPLAKSFFMREISDCDTIMQILQNTTQNLKHAGGTAQLDVSEGTNLFIKMEGKYRCKIHRAHNKGFSVGRKEYHKKEIIELIERHPELFSTNAAARTVLQSYLFPTLAYVAGPNEIAYYHQLGDYHRYHGIPMPWIVPRISATFITPVAQDMLEKCRLQPWDEIPHHWPQVIPNLETGMSEMAAEWLQSGIKYFHEELSPEVISQFIRHHTRKLQRKICMVRLRRQGIQPYTLHFLRNLLHPHEKLQERIINWWEFQSDASDNLIFELLKQADWHTEGHLYCFVK